MYTIRLQWLYSCELFNTNQDQEGIISVIITGKTGITGIFGYPIKHTLSPAMHNNAFKELGLDYVYVPFSVHPDGLKSAVQGALNMGVKGINVTIPHKEAILPHLDQLTKEAKILGAVNTVEISDGKLIGHNTDGPGFIKSIEKELGCSPKGKHIAIIGAGGAARGVGISLALAGARNIVFFNRSLGRAEKLAQEINEKTEATAEAMPLEENFFKKTVPLVDILINGTSIGMNQEDKEIINEDCYPKSGIVVDMIYSPPKTRFLETADKLGLNYLNGMGMLVYQGALAFEIWTRQKAPVQCMKDSLLRVIYGKQ